MFFWFNAGAIAIIASSNLHFEHFSGHWVILPLSFAPGFVTHVASVHLYWTIRRYTYSPSLLTSLLYVMTFYLAVRGWRWSASDHWCRVRSWNGGGRGTVGALSIAPSIIPGACSPSGVSATTNVVPAWCSCHD